jgi:hypothetical protein
LETKRTKNVDGLIVTTSVISSILNITPRRVRQLVEDKTIDRVKSGSFELIPTIKKYIIFLKTKSDCSYEDQSADAVYLLEKMKHERAKREIAELELAQMKGTMHKAEDVEKAMGNMLTAFRTKILSIPTKIAPHLIAQNEISLIQDIIQKEVYEVLIELGNYDPELFRSEKYMELENDIEEDESEDE